MHFRGSLSAAYQWYLDPKSQLPLNPKLQFLLPIVYQDYNFMLRLYLFPLHIEKRQQEEIQSALGLTLETFLISRTLSTTSCPIPVNMFSMLSQLLTMIFIHYYWNWNGKKHLYCELKYNLPSDL